MKRYYIFLIMTILIFFSTCNKSRSEKANQNAADRGDISSLESDAAGTSTTNGVQRLLTVFDNGVGYVHRFEYDGQNRMTKVSRTDTDEGTITVKTITYSGAEPVSLTETGNGYTATKTFKRNMNSVTVNPGDYETVLTLDSDGFIIQEIEGEYESSYEYINGNMTAYYGPSSIVTYTYDDQKSTSLCYTPKWILQLTGQAWFTETIWRNNMIEQSWSSLSEEAFDTDLGGGTNQITYEFDKDGYPIKAHWDFMGLESSTATFEYK